MVDERSYPLWDELIKKQSQKQNFLEEIRLMGVDSAVRSTPSAVETTGSTQRGMRGICNLRVEFNYPVSVIAGRNGSGKSTVLFAAACAYRVPGEDERKFLPSKLFPDYRPGYGMRWDERGEAIIDFAYLTPTGRRVMRWRRTSEQRWKRSFFYRKHSGQLERQVYLRTLSNLTNPSELRGVLGISRMKPASQESPLTASQIEFAQQLLPFNYSEVIKLSGDRNSNLLIATQKSGAMYSELHMAAGERAILRLSQEITQTKGALILIDEVETGLHPLAQKILMRELQKLALHNDLQIIVTTHSSVVLDSVHETGRIFLERNEEGEVLSHPPYHDIIQDALYGQSDKTFNLLCEDKVAEAILEGVFDIITSRLRIKRHSIRIERNAGSGEFAMHAKVFERFEPFKNFIFVLDGDVQNNKAENIKEKIMSALAGNREGRTDEQKEQDRAKYQERIIFLPDKGPPEEWVWSRMRACSSDLAPLFGMDSDDLNRQMDCLDTKVVRSSTLNSASKIIKSKLYKLSKIMGQPGTEDTCRVVARWEAGRKESDIQPLVKHLETAYWKWRSGT